MYAEVSSEMAMRVVLTFVCGVRSFKVLSAMRLTTGNALTDIQHQLMNER